MNEEKQEQEKKQRTKREYAKKGERQQKMMSFRLDNELCAWLNAQENKGRYINNLIATDMKKRKK